MAGITQNGQKSVILILVPKQKKKLLMEIPLMEGSFSYKDNDNSANSNNSDRIIAPVRIKSKFHKSMFRICVIQK